MNRAGLVLMTTPLATFDPSNDPWGTAMIASAVVVGFALLWVLVAVLMRQPACGAGRLMSVGLFAYLGTAVGGTWAIVSVPPPPAPPKLGPPVVIGADVPVDPDESKGDPKGAPKTKPGKNPIAPAEPPPSDSKVAPTPTPTTASPTAPAPTAPAPTPAPATGPTGNEAATPPSPPADVPATPPAAPQVAAVELGAPTLTGREALRFVDEVAHDDDKCSDAAQVAAAARELPGALDGMPRARVDKAAVRLEACRRKVIAARAWTLRKAGIAARTTFGDTYAKRVKRDGISVLVTLRGASKERVRIGGAGLDAATAARLLDGGLRDELIALGFQEIVLANMQSAVKETPAVPTDVEAATTELTALGLGEKISTRLPG